MQFLYKKKAVLKWFTFVELIVSLFISSIVLIWVFYFISTNIEEITKSNNEIAFYNSLNDFREKMLYFSNVYGSWVVIRNYETWTGSDTFIFKYDDDSEGIMVWVVPVELMKIETLTENYSKYYNKVLWYRKLSSSELYEISVDPEYVKTYTFFDDKIFKDLKIKDFQVDLYNSWAIINMDFVFIENYKKLYDWRSFDSLKWESYFNANLVF